MANSNQNYYSNPAFCQQSEYFHQKSGKTLSPERRQPPVGAQQEFYHSQETELPPKVGPKPPKYVQVKDEELVDDSLIYHRNERYTIVTVGGENTNRNQKHRYEFIPMQEHANGYPSSPRKHLQQQQQEDIKRRNQNHRYAVVPTEEPKITDNRYALVPVSELNKQSKYTIVSPGRGRYDYIPEISSPTKGNSIATQKLHELLTTPKKSPIVTQPQSPQTIDIFRTPNQTPQKQKMVQKLNYHCSTPKQQHSNKSKRTTAVVAPICSSPIQSVYSETTFSNRSESWMNLSIQKPPVEATLAVAAIMMILCGSLTSGLCFYMVSVVGRMYYLDFGTISGFTCLLLGLLGFRSRNCHWLPNRNYISGYIVLSAFSLLTCAGLLVLLFLQPKPGTALADVTSGAVCGISGLSLLLAASGVVATYCCKYPPPDNRVQHCAQGFTV